VKEILIPKGRLLTDFTSSSVQHLLFADLRFVIEFPGHLAGSHEVDLRFMIFTMQWAFGA
jgi:hypothetical protein